MYKTKKAPAKAKLDYDLNVNDKKGMPSQEHWCINACLTPEAIVDDPETAFNPMSGAKRPCMHRKVNECDH